ncbi:putative fad binding domain-containing protein [Phaeoacremonium minimum UCRPA7]|uniref:Putative fad binding domain-containing protein n=1 Tax=Phaeoacremonium minimum (strain UCR-PA7) TaxID=1286976 RepID=R8BCV4_PHAM7|nr:putative fad binding domain-containing protein [Phaeoacremonium minimum UCRPA7]EON97117.1 putative fad binding domain-containing protein [Phaeoacremonium minimum UCRPA7]
MVVMPSIRTQPYGLTVVGGRMGVVGVPGFLLGGGISFFGNEYGWASANIASYECVLADGTILNATATNEFSDLFWALRGGGNSFAIVTSFALKTIQASAVTVGQNSYGTGLRDEYLDSVFGFAFDGGLDKKAAITPTVTWTSSTGSDFAYSSFLFYNGNVTAPPALSNFTGPDALLPAASSTFSYRPFSDWSNETETGFERVHGMVFRFHVLSFRANREAMEFIHDTFLSMASQRLANVTNSLATLAMMPISESFISTNRNGTAGDPMGIDATKAPYIWVEEAIMHANPADTPKVDQFLIDVNAIIDEKLTSLNVASPYLYLNDADKNQPVFQGYAPENVARLKEIRSKYDPQSIYTDQMPGGWKVAAI